MKYIVCAGITDAASEVIEANGGSIKIISEQPLIQLITLFAPVPAANHDAYVLNGVTGAGICWIDDDALSRIVYCWNGEQPTDPSWDRDHVADTLEQKPLDPYLATIEKQTMKTMAALIALQKGSIKEPAAAVEERKDGLSEILEATLQLRMHLGIPLTTKKQ